MSRNDPGDQAPGQPGGPGHAIMARLDLDPPLGLRGSRWVPRMVNNIPNGGIDAKAGRLSVKEWLEVTNACLLKAMKCQALGGAWR